MRITSSGRILLLSILLALTFSGGRAMAQEEPPQSVLTDTVFQYIELRDGRIVATDTAGNDWFYDFDTEEFVQGRLEDDGEAGVVEFDPDADIVVVPPEIRCTEELVVKPFVSNVTVGEDEYVDGDITASGRVTVKGWVKGDVTSLRNRVLITSMGRVDGDILAPEVIVKDGGIVLGEIMEVESIIGPDGGWSPDGMIVVTSFTALVLFVGFIVITLMPVQFGNFSQCVSNNKAKTLVIGFIFLPAILLLIVLLAITLVGVVLLPLVPLVYLLAMIMGVVAFGNTVGRVMSAGLLGSERGLLFQSMVGTLIFMGLWFVTAVLLGSASSTLTGLGIAMLVVSIVISTYPILTGVGAAFLTRFGFKPYQSWKERGEAGERGAPSPAPPPIPKAPPEPGPSSFDNESDET